MFNDRTEVDLYENCIISLRSRFMRILTKNESLNSALISKMTFQMLHKGRRKSDYFQEDVACFNVMQDGPHKSLMAPAGFYESVIQTIYDFGVGLYVIDADKQTVLSDPFHVDVLPLKIVRSEWEACRIWQREAIQVMNTYPDGRFKVATAGGKSHLIKKLCKWLPTARILITDSSLSRLDDRHNDILSETGSCGIWHSKRQQKHSLRMVCSVGTLPDFSNVVWDIFIADEIHTLMTPESVAGLASVRCKRAYGFSANMEDRTDNADVWGEAYFGPLRVKREYMDVLEDEDVVPILVQWLEMPNTFITARPQAMHERARTFIWQNHRRNELFAKQAKFHKDSGRQTLVLTETTEHALVMGKLLGWPVIAKPPNPQRRQVLEEQGLLEPGQLEDPKFAERMQKKFQAKEILGLVANKMWHTGKDFVSLEVLCRMDAGATEIPSTQIPGRLSRKAPGKAFGLLIDCRDTFEVSCERRADSRASSYIAKGWKNASEAQIASWSISG